MRRPTLALSAALALFACDSSEVEGDDLRGVFERPSASASAPSASPAATTEKERASAEKEEPRIPERARRPVAGPCVERRGEPAALGHRVAKRPACRGSRILEHRDATRVPRYGCVYAPPDAAERKPLPLLLLLHDRHGDPNMVRRQTRLRARYRSLDLTGDPKHQGFVVLAPQARRLKDAVRWDSEYTAPDNPDVATLDHFVAALLEEGLVDGRQIYAVGAGNGGEMANLYAYLRPDRVAAFGLFGAAPQGLDWSCEGSEPPAAVLYRACDAVTPCSEVEQWLSSRQRAGVPTFSLRLGVSKSTEPSCASSKRACSEKKGQANHARWPKHREEELLEYLGRYFLESEPR